MAKRADSRANPPAQSHRLRKRGDLMSDEGFLLLELRFLAIWIGAETRQWGSRELRLVRKLMKRRVSEKTARTR